jgi:peptide/nickel transport system permease protein
MRLPLWGGWWAGGVLLVMVVAGVLVAVGMGDALTPDLTRLLQPPSLQAWLGTDDLGRDLLARVVLGLGTSVGIALAVLVVTAAVGIPLGLLAGWCGGRVDAVITLVTGMALSFPGLLLALALAAMLGAGVGNVVVALSVLGWVGFCRLARVQVQQVLGLPFVAAAQLAGLPWWRLWLRHLLPNAAPALWVEALLVLLGAVVAEAALSFLGLGIPAPQPSLGGLLRDGLRNLLVAPHVVLVPAVVLFGLTLGLNVALEGLQKRLAGGKPRA